jgi:hypothetical protein
VSGWTDAEVRLVAADEWAVGGILRAPADGSSAVGGVLLVPGSKHERDAFGALPETLAAADLASLRIDLRGRGTSRGDLAYSRLGARQRRQARLDVAAGLDRLALLVKGPLGVIAEQDTAADALDAVAADARVAAAVLLSAHRGERLVSALATRSLAVLALVSAEDRPGLRATTDAYLASAPGPSRLEVLHGLGVGATMLATRRFEHPDAEPLEAVISRWLASALEPGR